MPGSLDAFQFVILASSLIRYSAIVLRHFTLCVHLSRCSFSMRRSFMRRLVSEDGFVINK